jgi:ribosomal protein L7/L12
VKVGVSKEAAETLAKQLNDAGGTAKALAAAQ